jgi:signal transduction histidine kinase
MNKRQLRWLSIILPIFFGLVVLLILNIGFSIEIPTSGVIFTIILVALGATVLSFWIFNQISQREEEINWRAKQFEALNVAALTLTTELDLGVVLQKVVDLSRELVDARYGALGIYSVNQEYYDQFILSGFSEEERLSLKKIPRNYNEFVSIWDGGRPDMMKNGIRFNHDSDGSSSNRFHKKTLLDVPVVSKNKKIGDLILFGRKDSEGNIVPAFDIQDQQVLEMFASQAAIAIENASLVRQVQQLAVFEERERFGMDLHDGIIQSIYAVGLSLENVQRRFSSQPESTHQSITKAIHALNDVISDIRNYILDLRPQRFKGKDIQQGMKELAQSLRVNTFLNVNIQCDDVDPDLFSPEETVDILHIAQEALANIRKHARATDVDIALRLVDGNIQLMIEDNGGSIDDEDIIKPSGDGIRNMRERADLLDGDIAIQSLQTGGTCVYLTVPIKPRDE